MMQELAPWVAIAIAASTLVYAILSNNGKAYKSELEEMRTQIAGSVGRVDIVEDRVTRIETEMQHLPDKDSFHALALQVSEQRSDIRARATTIGEMRKSIDKLSRAIEESGSETRTN